MTTVSSTHHWGRTDDVVPSGHVGSPTVSVLGHLSSDCSDATSDQQDTGGRHFAKHEESVLVEERHFYLFHVEEEEEEGKRCHHKQNMTDSMACCYNQVSQSFCKLVAEARHRGRHVLGCRRDIRRIEMRGVYRWPVQVGGGQMESMPLGSSVLCRGIPVVLVLPLSPVY